MTERELIKKAVEIIKTWHNLDPRTILPEEAKERMWNLYYNNAPEMKEIREYLEQG